MFTCSTVFGYHLFTGYPIKDSEGWDHYRVEWNHYQRKEGGFGRMPEGSMSKKSEPLSPYEYSGCYRIGELCPVQGSKVGDGGMVTEQEADMLLGRIVILDEKYMLFYDCERKQGVRKGGDVFSGNHMVQKFILAGWEGRTITSDCVLNGTAPDHAMEQAVGKERYGKINGEIESNENGTVRLFTMEETDSLIMSSYLSGQYFILEKLEGGEEQKALEGAGWKEGGADEGKIRGGGEGSYPEGCLRNLHCKGIPAYPLL